MANDLVAKFFERYVLQPDESTPISHQTPEQVQSAVDELITVVSPLPLPEMDLEQRHEMAGKRFPDLQALMFDCAAGLRLSPEIAKKVQTAPELFEQIAKQDMEIGGFIKALQGLHESADVANLGAAAEADAICETIDNLVRSHTSGSGPLPDAGKKVLEALFAEPARVRAEAQANPSKSKEPADLVTSLEDQQDQLARKQAVAEFLKDVQSGAATEFGKRFVPALGDA